MKPGRVAISVAVFALLASLELAFVSSLPWPLNVAPLVFAASVYVAQHRGLVLDVWWMPAYGLLLDVLGLNRAPLSVLALGISAVVVAYLSRAHLSNRSLYGVLACGAAGYAVFAGIQGLTLLVSSFFSDLPSDWSAWATASAFQGILALVILFLFFQASLSRR